MSQIQILVRAHRQSNWDTYVDLEPPITISASRGFGNVTGDTELIWNGDQSGNMPSWLATDGRICVYAAMDDIDTDNASHFINTYYVESVDINKDRQYTWRIRGRDAMQVLLGHRVSFNYEADEEITIGNLTALPNASRIIRQIVANEFGPNSASGIELECNHYGFAITKHDGAQFPTGYSFRGDNAPFGEILTELSRDYYTDDGPYTFHIEIDSSNNASLFWKPATYPSAILSAIKNSDSATGTIDATDTRYAQKFTVPEQPEGVKPSVETIYYYMRPLGTLTGYWTIEADVAGDPSGVALSQSTTAGLAWNVPQKVDMPYEILTAGNDYWLVFYRTAGIGTLYATTTGTADQVKYFDGSWHLGSVENMWHEVSGNAADVPWTEGHEYISNTNFVSLNPVKTFYNMVNHIILNCGDDPSGVPIIVDAFNPQASLAFGVRSIPRSEEDIARNWLAFYEEPDSYPATLAGDTVNSYSEYVALARQKIADRGRSRAEYLLNEEARGSEPKWEVEAALRGTNNYYMGQLVTSNFNTVTLGKELVERNVSGNVYRGKKYFYINGITHNIDRTGWRTNIRMMETIR